MIKDLATSLIKKCAQKRIRLTTAESCTGGLIGAALTDVAGSSAVYEGGYVTYSNEAKMSMLGVPKQVFINNGAVSRDVVLAMAEGSVKATAPRTHLSIAVTGIAGPSGGSDDKPVGLVWFGVAGHSFSTHTEHHIFSGGDRNYVRMKTVETALQLLLDRV